MAYATAQAPPIFSRGSNVLDYWLLHAVGLTVQPHGGRVEEVIAPAPFARAETLIIRSRLRRRIAIPAAAVAAVEPATGRLLLDRRSDDRTSPARLLVAVHTACRSTSSWSRRAARWSFPRLRQACLEGARHVAAGSRWLAPHAVVVTRTLLSAVAVLIVLGAALVVRGTIGIASLLARSTSAWPDGRSAGYLRRYVPTRRARPRIRPPRPTAASTKR